VEAAHILSRRAQNIDEYTIELILGEAKMDALDGMPDNHGGGVVSVLEALVHVRCQHPALWTRPDAQELEHVRTHCQFFYGFLHLLEKVPSA